MKTRTILLALALTLAPATAHATYTNPEQTGHGSGSFEVCVTPTQPGPWTYVVAARDPRIIRVDGDSWSFGRTDGSWVRAVAVDGRARIVTAVPLSGAVGDSVKVRAPGTDATTDLHLIAVKAPTCTTPTPTPTGSPSWTASPTPTGSPSPSSSTTSTPSSSVSATSPIPSTSPTASPSKPNGSPVLPTTSAPSTSGTASGPGACGDSGDELACTGSNFAPLIWTALAVILAGLVLAWPRRTRRH